MRFLVTLGFKYLKIMHTRNTFPQFASLVNMIHALKDFQKLQQTSSKRAHRRWRELEKALSDATRVDKTYLKLEDNYHVEELNFQDRVQGDPLFDAIEPYEQDANRTVDWIVTSEPSGGEPCAHVACGCSTLLVPWIKKNLDLTPINDGLPLPISEMKWQLFKASLGRNPKKLKIILHWKVENDVTLDIVEEAQRLTQKTVFTPDDGNDCFFEILGSPNGYGVLLLLLDHVVGFGRKTVSEIRIHGDNLGMILAFELSDTRYTSFLPTPPATPLSKKEARAVKKRARKADKSPEDEEARAAKKRARQAPKGKQ